MKNSGPDGRQSGPPRSQAASGGRRRPASWSDRDRAELDVLLAEYETLRKESLYSINNRARVMVLGMAAVAALVASSVTVEDPVGNPTIVFAIYSFALPLVCSYVFLVWLGEAKRAERIGRHLAEVCEVHINAKLKGEALRWETKLDGLSRSGDDKLGPSKWAMVTLAIIALLGPVAGMRSTGTEASFSGKYPLLQLWFPYLLLAFTIGYGAWQWPRNKANRETTPVRETISRSLSRLLHWPTGPKPEADAPGLPLSAQPDGGGNERLRPPASA